MKNKNYEKSAFIIRNFMYHFDNCAATADV